MKQYERELEYSFSVSAAPKKRVSNAPPFFAKLQELSEILRKSHVQNFYKGKPTLLL